MATRILLDTHVLIRRLIEPHKLSKRQSRAIDEIERNGEQSCISVFTAIEIALLSLSGRLPSATADALFQEIDNNPAFRLLPITTEIAREVAAIGGFLRDPADQTIVATARVHRIPLVTSDQRIIDSRLVRTVE